MLLFVKVSFLVRHFLSSPQPQTFSHKIPVRIFLKKKKKPFVAAFFFTPFVLLWFPILTKYFFYCVRNFQSLLFFFSSFFFLPPSTHFFLKTLFFSYGGFWWILLFRWDFLRGSSRCCDDRGDFDAWFHGNGFKVERFLFSLKWKFWSVEIGGSSGGLVPSVQAFHRNYFWPDRPLRGAS